MSDRIDALEARIAALEDLLIVEEGELDVALLTRLRKTPGADNIAGAIQLAGSVNLDGRRAAWQTIHAAEALMDSDLDHAAKVLAALGHPLRLKIVQVLLKGTLRATELEEQLQIGSTGKLYHHLKELITAGVIVQPRRSQYTVPTGAMVPVLSALALVENLRGADEGR